MCRDYGWPICEVDLILADTAVWIAHFRSGVPEMVRLLGQNQIAMHPLIVAELALGSLRDRLRTLGMLERLTQVRVAQLGEVRRMIETHALYSRGIGLTDAHLLASVLITPGTQLWTLDKRFIGVARDLGVDSGL